MNLLEKTLQAIQKPTTEFQNFHSDFDELGDELGDIKLLLEKYATILGQKNLHQPKKLTIIACADHGVVEMNVSAYPQETTVNMTENYCVSRGAVANALSNFAKSDLWVVDMGVARDTSSIPNLIQKKIAYGTKNLAVGPAMTRAQAIQAIETGIALAEKGIELGYRCFLPGEMGIANTTSSACIAAVCCHLTPEQATGRGTNISDERLKIKIGVVRQALQKNKIDETDGVDILQKVGGFELGCITGIILGAAAHGSFVVVDGFNTGAAALIAQKLCPFISDYLMGSHIGAEPAHQAMLKQLKLKAYMDLKFRLGEATGSSIAVDLLDVAVTLTQSSLQKKFKNIFAQQPKEIFLEKINIDELDHEAMEACQFRLDNLAKPIYSVGLLEKIAVQLAGIYGKKQPSFDLKKYLFCLTNENDLTEKQKRLTSIFADHANADVTILHSSDNEFNFQSAETFAKTWCEKFLPEKEILGISFFTKQEKISDNLLGAFFGFCKAAIQKKNIIVLDNHFTEEANQIFCKHYPQAQNYFLHVQPDLLDLRIQAGGGCLASLGMKLIDASLHILNDMRTFAEANVAVAHDGPGAGRQIQ